MIVGATVVPQPEGSWLGLAVVVVIVAALFAVLVIRRPQ
jgi:hypothetical protein